MLIHRSELLRYALFAPNQLQYPGRYIPRRFYDSQAATDLLPHGVHPDREWSKLGN
jgi:hypothetical protein